MSSLCVITAIEIEFKTVCRALSERTINRQGRFDSCRGRSGANHLTVFKAEMGASEFIPWLADHLAGQAYDRLLVLGLAGGLHPRLKPGDAVIYDRCLKPRNSRENPFSREENASIECDSLFVSNLVQACERTGVTFAVGAGVTVDEVVADPSGKERLGRLFDALAVDMESFGLLQAARLAGIPAGVVRVISDDAATTLPDFSRAMTPDGRMRPWQLARVMSESPLATARFLRTLRPVMAAFDDTVRAALATEITTLV